MRSSREHIVDIKYNGQILTCILHPDSNADFEVNQFMATHQMPPKYKDFLLMKFQNIINDLNSQPHNEQIFSETNYNTYSTNNQYNIPANENFQQNSTLVNESLQQNTDDSKLYEQSIYEKLYQRRNEFRQEQPEQQKRQHKTTTVQRQNEVLQKLYEQSQYKDIKYENIAQQGPKITKQQQQRLFEKLSREQLNHHQHQYPSKGQQSLTYEERVIKDFDNVPEVTERVEMNQTSKDLTENYSFYGQLQQKAENYQSQRIKQILQTTNSIDVVNNVTRNMTAADRLYYLEEFKKRQAEKENSSINGSALKQSNKHQRDCVTKDLMKSTNRQGREVYKYQEFKVDFKPKINEVSRQLAGSGRKDLQHDTQIKMQNNTQLNFPARDTFRPTLVSKQKNYQQEVLNALFQ